MLTYYLSATAAFVAIAAAGVLLYKFAGRNRDTEY